MGRFDAIFTLNQDLLLERHYLDALNPRADGRGAGIPGVQGPKNLSPFEHDRWKTEPWTVADEPPDLRSQKNTQPVFKLHGSSNWQRSDGADLLVVGGAKMKAIRESKVLSWYHDEFARRIAEPDTRLMTIGYGFQDHHVNEPIYKTRGLPIFIVDPAGIEVGLKPRERTAQIPIRNPLDDKNIVGISKRPLSTTFGNDSLERAKVLRFFN